MREIETILNDYRKGSLKVRLNLFLFHRELRCEFTEIENDENASLNGDKKKFNKPFRKNRKSLMFPFGILKKRGRPAG